MLGKRNKKRSNKYNNPAPEIGFIAPLAGMGAADCSKNDLNGTEDPEEDI